MTEPANVPDASVYRLSLYHCYVGEALRVGETDRITSRRLAEDLGIKEETVRRDMSFIGGVGRPGAGYDPRELFAALQTFLGLSDKYPIVMVGSAQMLGALSVVFPANSYGVDPVAYFSEVPDDVGTIVHGVPVRYIDEISDLDTSLGVSVALVACSPTRVQDSLDLLARAGVSGVMLLTPSIKVKRPEGMTVTHVRMPCDIKSLACRCRPPMPGE